MSFEICCPHCRAALIVEPGTWKCYACGQMIEVEAPADAAVTTDGADKVIRFLRGLLFDGELSGDEVWSLANWLNKQPRELCESWPANVLIPLLQDVYEDGEVTAEEMLKVANTLVAIEREWISRSLPIESGTQAGHEPAAGVAELLCPQLPVVDYVTNVASSDGNGEYQVDLRNHTCTCPDWLKWRRSAPAADYRRMCKHMARLFHALAIADQIEDPMFGAFVEDHYERGRGTLPHDDWILEVVNGIQVLYGHSPDNPWVNVFAPQGSSIHRFGFNKEERRWSYGESPKGLANFFRHRFRRM